MSKKEYATYNFVLVKSTDDYHSYFDTENVVSLRIIESGWLGKYNCILEWGEYEQAEMYVYTVEQIQKYFRIKTFLRKEKLIKIHENMS